MQRSEWQTIHLWLWYGAAATLLIWYGTLSHWSYLSQQKRPIAAFITGIWILYWGNDAYQWSGYFAYLLYNVHCLYWVLVKVHRDQTHSTAQYVPRVGVSSHIAESLTTDPSEWRVSRSLHLKSILYFVKG